MYKRRLEKFLSSSSVYAKRLAPVGQSLGLPRVAVTAQNPVSGLHDSGWACMVGGKLDGFRTKLSDLEDVAADVVELSVALMNSGDSLVTCEV